MAGFLSQPQYMKSLREAFRRISVDAQRDAKVQDALKEFDSLFSLRLYYTVEVFTEIPMESRGRVEELLELPLSRPVAREEFEEFLKRKAERPIELYRYLSRLYGSFHRVVNALGGESRDMLNRPVGN